MKKTLLMGLLLMVAWAVGSVAQDEMTDEALLGQMDFQRFAAYFNPELPSTTFTVEIVAQRPDGAKQATVQVSFRFDPEDLGRGGFRIDYLSPEELSGDVFLGKGDEIFFWNPDLIEPLKVNGTFEVFGDATVAEVVGIQFSGDYTIEEREDRALADGSDGIWLKLKATRDSVAFPLAEVTARADNFQPHELKLFDESGDLLHDNTFESYAVWEDGRPYFERQLLDNRIVPVNQTLLTVSNIKNAELSFDLFDPKLLGANQ